ncbi:MAG TPA: glycosyltransferase family 1 protein, partial [Firmicutes bacterium]|nr:glycosyltransferase family 1 protein [Bacillota bacterium]
MIKIGYYTTITFFGGGEVYLKILLNNLPEKQFDSTLFCMRKFPLDKVFGDRFPPNLKLHYIDEIENETSRLLRVIKLIKLFKGKGLSIIHFNGNICKIPAIAAKLAGKKVVATYHVLPHYPEGIPFSERVKERIFWSCCDRVIYVSGAGKKAWERLLGIKDSRKSRVVYNGVDFSEIKMRKGNFNLKKELNLEKNSVVGMISRLHPMKGHRYLIEAAPLIKKEIPDVKFVLSGDGPLEEELKKMVREKNLEDLFLFLGFREDVIEIIGICDVVVFPSIFKEN